MLQNPACPNCAREMTRNAQDVLLPNVFECRVCKVTFLTHDSLPVHHVLDDL